MRTERGFVLPLTLWIIAGAMVAVAFADRWNDRYFERALDAQTSFQERLDSESLLAVLKYNLNAELVTLEGLPIEGTNRRVMADGRVYSAGQGIFFTMEEGNNLINVNYPSNPQMPALLERLGVPLGQRRALIERLSDYTDTNDRRRIGGAERLTYRQHDLDGPANRVVYTPLELFDVYGWQTLKSNDSVKLLRETTVAWGNIGINLNNASPEVLGAIPWLKDRDVETLLNERKLKPFVSAYDFKQRLARPDWEVDDLLYGYLPGDFFKVRFWSQGAASLTEVTIRLAPVALDAKPWLTALRHKYPNHLSEENAEQIALLAD